MTTTTTDNATMPSHDDGGTMTTVTTVTTVTTFATVEPPTTTAVLWNMKLDVTLPSGVSAASFVKDAQVKKGVEKGIAIKLEISADWVKAVLTLAKVVRRRLSSAAGINVNVAISIPKAPGSSNFASSLRATLQKANSASEKIAWGSAIATSVSMETGKVHKVALESAVLSGPTMTTTIGVSALELAKSTSSTPVALIAGIGAGICVGALFLLCLCRRRKESDDNNPLMSNNPEVKVEVEQTPPFVAGAELALIDEPQALFSIGEKVKRRDVGEDWGEGYVTSVVPLMVTVEDNPWATGCKWKEVQKMPQVESRPRIVPLNLLDVYVAEGLKAWETEDIPEPMSPVLLQLPSRSEADLAGVTLQAPWDIGAILAEPADRPPFASDGLLVSGPSVNQTLGALAEVSQSLDDAQVVLRRRLDELADSSPIDVESGRADLDTALSAVGPASEKQSGQLAPSALVVAPTALQPDVGEPEAIDWKDSREAVDYVMKEGDGQARRQINV